MSADNGVYVAEFVDGWRVAEASQSRICDLDLFEYATRDYNAIVKEIWGRSAAFHAKADALLYAHEIAEHLVVCEYGVVVVGKQPAIMGAK